MIIKSESIEIEESDLQGLAPGIQKALAAAVLPAGSSPVLELNRAIGLVIRNAKRKAGEKVLADLQPLAVALGVADDPKKDAVQIFINQAKAEAGVPVTPVVKDEIAGVEVQPKGGLLAKVKALFN